MSGWPFFFLSLCMCKRGTEIYTCAFLCCVKMGTTGKGVYFDSLLGAMLKSWSVCLVGHNVFFLNIYMYMIFFAHFFVCTFCF